MQTQRFFASVKKLYLNVQAGGVNIKRENSVEAYRTEYLKYFKLRSVESRFRYITCNWQLFPLVNCARNMCARPVRLSSGAVRFFVYKKYRGVVLDLLLGDGDTKLFVCTRIEKTRNE